MSVIDNQKENMDLVFNPKSEYRFLQPPDPPLNTKGLMVVTNKGVMSGTDYQANINRMKLIGAVPQSKIIKPPTSMPQRHRWRGSR